MKVEIFDMILLNLFCFFVGFMIGRFFYESKAFQKEMKDLKARSDSFLKDLKNGYTLSILEALQKELEEVELEHIEKESIDDA